MPGGAIVSGRAVVSAGMVSSSAFSQPAGSAGASMSHSAAEATHMRCGCTTESTPRYCDTYAICASEIGAGVRWRWHGRRRRGAGAGACARLQARARAAACLRDRQRLVQGERGAARLGALLELHVVAHRRELRVAEAPLRHALREAVLHVLRLRGGGRWVGGGWAVGGRRKLQPCAPRRQPPDASRRQPCAFSPLTCAPRLQPQVYRRQP